MGCSKGRGLFHKPRASFLRCWVICKATPGRRCAAPRRLRSLGLWLQGRARTGQEGFQPQSWAQGSARSPTSQAGGSRESSAPLTRSPHRAECSSAEQRVSRLCWCRSAATSHQCNPQHSPMATTWTRTRYHDFVFTASFPSQCTKAARASFWSFNSEHAGRGVFTQGCVLPPFLVLFSPFLALAYKMDGGRKAG